MPAAFTLAELHSALQVVMGWEDSHLHQFTVDRVGYTALTPEDPDDMRDEGSLRLSELARKGKSFTYEYDFGDGWEHRITVEDVDHDATDQSATCVGGKRACPPEDSGGPYGYMRLVKILANPRHREHEEMSDWVGDFDSAAFDITLINRQLLSGPRVRTSRPARARRANVQ